MLKNKKILFISLIFALILLLPNISHAIGEQTATSTTSTGVTVQWSYKLNENDEVIDLLCKNVTSITGTVEIPSTIDGKTVVALGKKSGDGAFEGCTGLTGVTIPNTIRMIGYYAFSGCYGLQNIVIPDSVTSIESDAFRNCKGLSSVTIGNSVVKIGSRVFLNTAISNLVIPNSVTSIGSQAFSGCKGLSSITLPENLTFLEDQTFEGCSALTEIIIPEHVTAIGTSEYEYMGVFTECKNLSKILIPDSVASIADGAFGYKSDHKKLTIYGNEGKVSQRYAQENSINFKLISEWDESEAGDDVTPPTVNSIEINYSTDFDEDSNMGIYYAPEGFNLAIYVNLNEPIHGEIAPTLTIKVGQGENIELNNGVISGSRVIYTYTIQKHDKGIISAISLQGGNITDAAGNEAEWDEVLPEIKTDNYFSKYVYANGTGGVDGGNNGNNDEPGDVDPDDKPGDVDPDDKPGEVNPPDDNNPNGGTGTEGEDKKDDSQSPNPIPNAGKATLFSVFMVIVFAGAVSFTKIRKYRQV